MTGPPEYGQRLGALRAGDPPEISGYRLCARIGQGGMGTVFLSHTRGGQPVALKLIKREYAADAAFRARFAREVAAARRIAGPHLVPLVDHGASSGQPWLATRYVPGVPLDEGLAAHGPLPVATVLRLIAGTARALHAVHIAGVVHRDVKPANLLLAADGPWLLDFGIARAAGAAPLTTAGRLVGTPRHMSPEHALGRTVGPASDVFALGLVAAEAATGSHPYGRGNGLAIAARIAGTDREPPSLEQIPRPVREIVAACLAPDPGERPSAAELATRCAEAAGSDVGDFRGWLPAGLVTPVSTAEAETVRALPPTAALTVTDDEWSRRVRRWP